AALHDRIEGLQRLVGRRRGIVEVYLIQVHVVGAEAPQRRVDRREHVLARSALLPGRRTHLAAALGRDDELLASTAQPLSYDLLRAPSGLVRTAQGVNVGRIQERDARFGGGIED